MSKSKSSLKVSKNYGTLGCVMRNHVTAIKMCVEAMKKEKREDIKKQMLDVCHKSSITLLGISLLPQVEGMRVSRKLKAEIDKYEE